MTYDDVDGRSRDSFPFLGRPLTLSPATLPMVGFGRLS